MKYLLQTIIKEPKDGSIVKFEIFTNFSSLNHHKKVPEGSFRILKYRLESESKNFEIVDNNVDVQALYDANQPNPNTWYSDGNDRVGIDMLVNYLMNL